MMQNTTKEEIMKLKKVGLLRTLIIQRCTESAKQRNDFVGALRKMQETMNSADKNTLDNIINFYNLHLNRPLFEHEIKEGLSKWVERDWNDFSLDTLTDILNFFTNDSYLELKANIQIMDKKINELYTLVSVIVVGVLTITPIIRYL
jgi:hypothetical protein